MKRNKRGESTEQPLHSEMIKLKSQGLQQHFSAECWPYPRWKEFSNILWWAMRSRYQHPSQHPTLTNTNQVAALLSLKKKPQTNKSYFQRECKVLWAQSNNSWKLFWEKAKKNAPFSFCSEQKPWIFANGRQESFIAQIRLLVSVMNEESYARSSKAGIMIHWAAGKWQESYKLGKERKEERLYIRVLA